MAYSNAQITESSHPTGQQSPPSNRRSEYKALNEPFDTSRRKSDRELDGEVGKVQMEMRPRERSKDERRLLPGRDVAPAHAPPLEPEQRYRNAGEPTEASAKKLQGRAYGGIFRAVDTLSSQPHALKAARISVQLDGPANALRKLDPPRVRVPGTRAHNHLPSSQRPYETLFSNDHERTPKRQKRDDVGTSNMKAAQRTDFARINEFPGCSISRKVDAHSGFGREKKRRRSRDGAHSSRTSTAASPIISPRLFGPGGRSAGSSPLVLVPDDEVELVSEYRRTNPNGRHEPEPSKKGAYEPLPDPPLRVTFQRDVPDALDKPQLRPRKRTKAAPSKPVSSIADRTSTGSIDELSGEKTVGPLRTRSESFENRRIRVPGGEEMSQMEFSRSHHAGSIPTPTDAPSLNVRSNKKPVATVNSKRSSDATGDKARIELQSIICRACCLEGGDLQLVWVPDDKIFHIERNGHRWTVPQKDKMVEIGSRETRSVTHASGKEMLAIQMKGSASEISNGNILVETSSLADLNKFLDILQHSLEVDPRMERVPLLRMEGIVKTQGPEIQKDHDKYSKRVSNSFCLDDDLLGERKRPRHQQLASDEEEIKYEPEDSEQIHPTKRSRMRSGDLDVSFSPPAASKYFSNNGLEPRRLLRQAKAVEPGSRIPPPPVRWTHDNKIGRWAHSVVYPPEGATRRVTVEFDDIERLDEGEFLNDSLISFSLRRIEENMNPEHKTNVHFFNSFFYEALTKKSGKKGFYYDAVSRWTKNKDLFDFPYVVVPINIEMHWFVVIICNLNKLHRKPAAIDLDTDDSDEMLDDVQQLATEQIPASILETTNSNAPPNIKEPGLSLDHLSISDGDKPNNVTVKNSSGSGRGDVHAPASSQSSAARVKKGGKKAPPPSRKYDPDAPTIITLDSFGSSHPCEARVLKDYLNAEADSKRGMLVDPKDLQGLTAKGIPEQTNFCDCGVFLVGYIEEFAKDPRKFVTKVLQRELDRQNDFASFDPSAKRAEIREELLQLQQQQEADRRAKKSAKKLASLSQSAALAIKPGQPEETAKHASAIGDDINGEVRPSQSHMAYVAVSATLPLNSDSSTKPSRQHHEPEDIPMSVPRPLPSSPLPERFTAGSHSEREAIIDGESTAEVPDSQEAVKSCNPDSERMLASL